MHQCVYIILPKRFASLRDLDDIISKMMEAYYEEGGSKKHLFRWDHYTIGGRWNGVINQLYDAEEYEKRQTAGMTIIRNFRSVAAVLATCEEFQDTYYLPHYLIYYSDFDLGSDLDLGEVDHTDILDRDKHTFDDFKSVFKQHADQYIISLDVHS